MKHPTIIIGAGPAGLTAAYELGLRRHPTVVLEADDQVGGLSRTVEHNGYRFDIGGHRFYTKSETVQRIWHDLLADDLLTRDRLSRILYGGKLFDYPLRPTNALANLGPVEAVRVLASYLRARLSPHPEETSFEEWVVNRFGRRLFEIFFETYTEKVWGMPCSEISADWASQRIKDLDLGAAVRAAFRGTPEERGEVITTLIDRFEYPRLGPGMMWERCVERVAGQGIETRLETPVVRLRHDGRRVLEVEVAPAASGRDRTDGDDGRERLPADEVISSMPLRSLLLALDPAPPAAVLDAARELRYRDFLTVALVVDRPDLFPDQWLYVHSPEVQVGRIQNFKNWSPEMVPDPGHTTLGLEYFVQHGDELWSAPDAELVALGRRECAELGVVRDDEVIDAAVVRAPKAYPVYDRDYEPRVEILRSYLAGFENLQAIGRNGQHRYNNQDHSMLTGVYAARNLLARAAGAPADPYDLWQVNTEREYLEEVRELPPTPDRAVPRPLSDEKASELAEPPLAASSR